VTERVLMDTGPLVAWLDEDDQWHDAAVELSHGLRPPFSTCEAVITEACFLLQHLPRAIDRIAAWLARGHIHIAFSLGPDTAPRVLQLISKYRDHPMSLADACLVVMIEQGIGKRVFTLDDHFRRYRHSGRRLVPVLMPE